MAAAAMATALIENVFIRIPPDLARSAARRPQESARLVWQRLDEESKNSKRGLPRLDFH
jgi:hypothetical protein